MKLNIQMFGGRGASSGMSKDGHPYGTEYKTLHTNGNVKYIRYNFSTASKSPFETQTKGRVYALVNYQDQVKAVVYFDEHGMKCKEIDITGRPHYVDGSYILPHTHLGYNHGEEGTRPLTKEEIGDVDIILKEWYNYECSK